MKETDYDLTKNCQCEDKSDSEVINHSLMWGDGDVVCNKCKGFIRKYDSG